MEKEKLEKTEINRGNFKIIFYFFGIIWMMIVAFATFIFQTISTSGICFFLGLFTFCLIACPDIKTKIKSRNPIFGLGLVLLNLITITGLIVGILPIYLFNHPMFPFVSLKTLIIVLTSFYIAGAVIGFLTGHSLVNRTIKVKN